MTTTPRALRPHHGLCLLHFVGRGYSEAFVANLAAQLAELEAHPEREVELRIGGDILCACCPHWGEGGCDEREKVARIDRMTLAGMGMAQGDRVRWDVLREAAGRLAGGAEWAAVCEECQWYGLCCEVRAERRREHGNP